LFGGGISKQAENRLMPRGGKISPATEFKPGQSGNPKGRPKVPDLKKEIAIVLSGSDKENGLYTLLKKIFERAKSGDMRAAELLLKYGYGLPNPMPQENESQPRVINTTYEIVKDEDDDAASS
jgi:hypothetical protein